MLYSFYSNKPIPDIFSALKVQTINVGYQFDYHEYDFEQTLLCYKNEEMLKYHLDNGYNTDLDSEGCFCIEAKDVRLYGKACLVEFENDTDFEPYDIHLAFGQVFYYRLITPNNIDICEFSSKIYELFTDILKS